MNKTIVFAFFLLIHTISNAQVHYKFSHFTTDDGLPTNSIYAITEDQIGNLILGTDNGLTFFNGTDFKTLNVKDGLINPYIVAVCKDEKGVLWFLNYGGKLQKFENNKIINTPIFSDIYNQIFNIKNNLFLYTIQNRYSNRSYSYTKINKENFHIIKPNKIAASQRIALPMLVQDNQEIRFLDNSLVFKNFKIPLNSDVKFLHKVIFRKNDVCLLDENFLFFVDFKGKIINKIKLPQPLSVNPTYKYDFIIDQQENCWLSIQSKGVYILKNNDWNPISENLGLNSSDNINFLYCDKMGKIWIATNENGLFCIPSTLVSSIRFKNQENYFNGFANSFDKKTLFISTKFSLFSYQNKKISVLKNSELEIKIGNYNTLPVFYTPIKVETNWDRTKKILTISGKQIIKKEGEKYYVLAGNSSINLFEKENFKSINAKISKKEKIKQVVFYKNEYYFNNAKSINIRTFDSNFLYNKRALRFKIKGYIEDFIFINDTMWVAANNTVYRVYNERIIDSIVRVNHVKLDNIHKIKTIAGAVYLCAGNGLFIISKNGNRVLNKYNFLPNNDVYNVELFDNELLVATKDGLGKVNKFLIEKRSVKPTLNIFYNSTTKSEIEISADQESVTLYLKIQNFEASKNQIIQYKIDKLSWITVQSNFLNFQSLSYGKHIVSVRVKDVNSLWVTKTLCIQKAFPVYLKWWFLVLANALISGLIYFIFQGQIRKLKAKKQLEIDTNNRVAELRQSALSAMMNPHFVFNSLNAIQYFVNSNQKEKSSEHLAKLSRLVRLFLTQAAEPFISLEDEINRLKLYVELEQTRFGNFYFAVNFDSNLNIKSIKIPNMIVQPFIENAILHGVSHLKENDGKINLNFQLNQDVLTIEVIDNGFGIDANKLKNDKHISKGIALITERIQILQESYPEKIFSITQQQVVPDASRKGHKVFIKVTI